MWASPGTCASSTIAARFVHSNLINSSETRQGGERANTNKIAADLNDGFYTLQVRAVVAIPGEAEDLVEASQHIKVSDGKWTDIDDIQWRAESRFTTAFTDVEAEDLARRTK